LVFNPKAFKNETLMFRTLELIFRNLGDVAYKHFQRERPEFFGKSTQSELTQKEKS